MGTALQRWADDDWTFAVSVVDSAGIPLNFTGYRPGARFAAAGSSVYSDLTLSNGGISWLDAANAKFQVSVPRTLTGLRASRAEDPLPARLVVYWLDTHLKRQTGGVIALDVADGASPTALDETPGITVAWQDAQFTLQVSAEQGPPGPSEITSSQITDVGATGAQLIRAGSVSAARSILGTAGADRTEIDDTDYQVVASDVLVGIKSLTTSRTITLPPPDQYPTGQTLVVQDETGLCSPQLPITIVAPAGSTIAGQAQITLASAYQRIALNHNSSNLWTFS